MQLDNLKYGRREGLNLSAAMVAQDQAFKKKIKSVDFFHTSQTPDLPKVWKIFRNFGVNKLKMAYSRNLAFMDDFHG